MGGLSDNDLRRVMALLTAHSGLQCDRERVPGLGEILTRRIAACGGEIESYLCRLASPESAELLILAPELTVAETYFLREPAHYELLCELAARCDEARPLRVLCAGCASGEEAYSAAITLCESGLAQRAHGIEIQAFDLNGAAIARARAGHYGPWALRATSESIKRKYFQYHRNNFVLTSRIRRMVSFEVRNLMTAPRQTGAYDVIFCRNVLMYLTPHAAAQACAWLAQALIAQGCAFIGQAETLRGLTDRLQPHFIGQTLVYKPAPAVPAPQLGADQAPAAVAPRPASAGHGAQPRHSPPASREALVKATVESARRGNLSEVERNCRMLAAAGEDSAAINYLLALCREYAGDYRRAMEHDRIAIARDPGFAMPHLHMGLLAFDRGDFENAGRALEHARQALLREDALRLAMFSDGFGRHELMALASARLKALEALR